MYSNEIRIRVRYGETDRMGYLYYGNYAQYYEVGRVELIRSLGVSYKILEDEGIMLPVLDMSVKFLRPVHYDELITVRTILPELPDVRIQFEYELTNEANELINTGKTTLVFFDSVKRKPCRIPADLLAKMAPYF